MKTRPRTVLSLFDSICIIVGIIIGAGIYETSPAIAAGMGSGAGVVGIWLAGGVLALSGALCYAELATAYPRAGGDYEYLRRAFGPGTGFMFGWFRLLIIRPGDIALMAFIFARYAHRLYGSGPLNQTMYAAGAVIILTIINILGVRQGSRTQNLLSTIKAAGLLAIVVAGFCASGNVPPSVSRPEMSFGGVQLALILVLFTYGGWNEIAYIAAEVRHPARTIVRALVLGTSAVILIYLLTNAAFLHALGFAGLTGSDAVAVDTVGRVLPAGAAQVIAVLICISTLGAINGLIFTGARISYAMGSRHVIFRKLGQWDETRGTPTWALTVQGGISLVIILLAGSFIETILYTAPIVWLFFLATAVSVVVLRRREPGVHRPYRISAYPLPLIIFCLSCVFMLYTSCSYAFQHKPYGLLIAGVTGGIGIVIYLLFRRADETKLGVGPR